MVSPEDSARERPASHSEVGEGGGEGLWEGPGVSRCPRLTVLGGRTEAEDLGIDSPAPPSLSVLLSYAFPGPQRRLLPRRSKLPPPRRRSVMTLEFSL